ncbi:hypothetical protein MQM1_026 [Aeromonas phage vB_AsaP_MQM1]|nr:hypothetical protein MQM1_026 [Aeromonas phage vB_AsaP_MQM1]
MDSPNSRTYRVPLESLRPLRTLREALKAAGFPLANNEEIKAPDSVIRIKQGWKHVMSYDKDGYRHYVVEPFTAKEIVPNDL